MADGPTHYYDPDSGSIQKVQNGLDFSGLRLRQIEQAKEDLPKPQFTAPLENIAEGTKLGNAYNAAKSWLDEHEDKLSEKYLKPFREGLDNMAADLQQAAESGHTKTGGPLTTPTRLLAEGTGELLKAVPVGKDVKSTAGTMAMAIPPEFKGLRIRPLSEATVAEGGVGAASSEELARNNVFVKYSKSGKPTYLGKSPDANLESGEAILAVNKKTGDVKVQNTKDLADSEALQKFGAHAKENFRTERRGQTPGISPTGAERRTIPFKGITGPSPTRMAVMKDIREKIESLPEDDPARKVLQDRLSDMKAHPFERADEGVDINKVRAAQAKSKLPEQSPKDIIEKQGLVYKGELSKGSGVHMFEHPDHPGKTAALNEDKITPASVKAKMDSKLKEFEATKGLEKKD